MHCVLMLETFSASVDAQACASLVLTLQAFGSWHVNKMYPFHFMTEHIFPLLCLLPKDCLPHFGQQQHGICG